MRSSSFFSDFWKCARGRAEGRKTVFTVPSLTRERFDLESSTLQHFVAQQNPHPTGYSDLPNCESGRAEGPTFDFCCRNRNAYNSRTRYRTEFGFAAFHRPNPCGVQVFFSDFGKCVRGRAEGWISVFTLPSLTQKRFDVEGSTLRHFIAWSNPNSKSYLDLKCCVLVRVEGPLFSQLL